MADPATIIALISSSLSIATKVISTAKTINDLRIKYKTVEFNVSVIDGRLKTIKAALSKVKSWCETEDAKRLMTIELEEGFVSALLSCDRVMGGIDEHLEKVEKGWNHGKLRHLWDEDSLRAHETNLNSQINALNLLLLTIQLPTGAIQKAMLAEPSNMEILDEAFDCGSSYIRSCAQSTRYAESDVAPSRSMSGAEFAFDDEAIRTSVYRRAFMTQTTNTPRSQDPPVNSVQDNLHPAPAPALVPSRQLYPYTTFEDWEIAPIGIRQTWLCEEFALLRAAAESAKITGSSRFSLKKLVSENYILSERAFMTFKHSALTQVFQNQVFQDKKGKGVFVSSKKQFEMTEILIEGGADLRYADRSGQTILHQLLPSSGGLQNVFKTRELIQTLIAKGVDVNMPDQFGNTILHRVVTISKSFSPADMVSNVLATDVSMLRSTEGSINTLLEDLLKAGADVNARNALGETPLHLAARNGLLALQTGSNAIRLLVEFGADVNARTLDYASVLHSIAAHEPQATTTHDSGMVSINQSTIREWKWRAEMTQFLLDSGAEITDSPQYGTPLDVARETKGRFTIPVLYQASA